MVKNPPANAGDLRDVDLNPGLGISSVGSHGNPLKYLCLKNPMDREAWDSTVNRVAQSQTQLKQLSTHAQSLEQQLIHSEAQMNINYFGFLKNTVLEHYFQHLGHLT